MLINLAALTASAQIYEMYDINWSTIDGGGGPASGGTFSLNGTIGQPDAGVMSGGVFTITGGFWGGVSAESFPRLSIRLVPGIPNRVVLWWPIPSTGFVLQRMCDDGAWTDVTQAPIVVDPNKEVTLQATGQFCLFRLARP